MPTRPLGDCRIAPTPPPNSCWFHIVLTTYGNWLPGDARGYRTRNHRVHVEGDYKDPSPEGRDVLVNDSSERQMTDAPALLSPEHRELVGIAVRDRFEELGALVAIIAVARKHLHILVKLPPSFTRAWTGLVKKHAWFEMRPTGRHRKLWAGGAKFVKVRDRPHQLNVYYYIKRHLREGAWVWRHADREAGRAGAEES